MKYYLLEYSTEKKEIGTYPQTDGYYPNYDVKHANSIINLKSEKLPEFYPDLRFELHNKAKMTDIIKAGNMERANGLLMNHRTYELFKEFCLPESDFFEGFVEKGGKRTTYYWLHLVDQPLSKLDFLKSRFYTIMLIFKKDQDIIIESELDLKLKCESLGKLIFAEKIVLNQNFKDLPYDIFQFPLIQKPNTFFVSEKLANKLIAEKITGIKIIEQSII